MKLSVSVALASALAGMTNAAAIASPDPQGDGFRPKIPVKPGDPSHGRPWGPTLPQIDYRNGRRDIEAQGTEGKTEDAAAAANADTAADLAFEERDYNTTDLAERDLETRGKAWPNVFCDTKWKDVNLGEARERAKSIWPDGVGYPQIPGGPGYCERVACAYNVGIVICNDNYSPLFMNSWKPVVDGANEIFAKCSHHTFGKGLQVRGQAFHKDNWNVIVRKENC